MTCKLNKKIVLLQHRALYEPYFILYEEEPELVAQSVQSAIFNVVLSLL